MTIRATPKQLQVLIDLDRNGARPSYPAGWHEAVTACIDKGWLKWGPMKAGDMYRLKRAGRCELALHSGNDQDEAFASAPPRFQKRRLLVPGNK